MIFYVTKNLFGCHDVMIFLYSETQDYCWYANWKLYLVGEKVALVPFLQWVHWPTLPLLPENDLYLFISLCSPESPGYPGSVREHPWMKMQASSQQSGPLGEGAPGEDGVGGEGEQGEVLVASPALGHHHVPVLT